ncbi:MAG: hypothetical protein H7X91_09200 [Burkholderiales bacterium]|nr:hypothetical protein [Burkholderiales bacterium]
MSAFFDASKAGAAVPSKAERLRVCTNTLQAARQVVIRGKLLIGRNKRGELAK